MDSARAAGSVHLRHVWEWESAVDPAEAQLADALEPILYLLGERGGAFQELTDCEVAIEVVLYRDSPDARPEITLDARAVKILAATGASFGLSIW